MLAVTDIVDNEVESPHGHPVVDIQLSDGATLLYCQTCQWVTDIFTSKGEHVVPVWPEDVKKAREKPS